MNRFDTLLKSALAIAGALAAGSVAAQSLPESTALAIRLNAGGSAYTDSLGRHWEGDQYYNTGNKANPRNAIAGTKDDRLYQQNRWDGGAKPELQYAIPVPNGYHTVKLHFAETWSGAFQTGARVFDVRIEDQRMLDNLDIYREAGKNKALVKSLPVTVHDGELNIEFIHQVQNPTVSGIEVLLDLPPAPSHLTGSAVDSQEIALRWDEAPDNELSSVAGYRIYRDGVELATTTDSFYSDMGLSPATSYRYVVVTYDQFGYVSEPSDPVTVTTLPADLPAIRLNAGGNAYTDHLGQHWGKDQHFNTGNKANPSSAISGTEDDQLYRQNRWDADSEPELEYGITVPNGSYTVRLHFAETWSGAFREGARVFDVLIEDQLVLGDLDVYREAGRNTALVKSLPVTVADGELNIQFRHQVQNPMVSAIEIIPQIQLPADPPATRLNAGGDAYTDQLGQHWAEDQNYNTGNRANPTSAIAGTEDDALYQQNRWDSASGPELQYAIALANQEYTVRLHFAETWSGAFRVGARVFDVMVEDQLVLDDLDVFREAGKNTALVKNLPVSVTDGELNIQFLHQIQNPMVSAIEVIPQTHSPDSGSDNGDEVGSGGNSPPAPSEDDGTPTDGGPDPVDALPIARSDSVSTNEGSGITIDVLANDTGLDNAPLILRIVEPPSGGNVDVVANRIQYTPNPEYFGQDSVVYKITDADGDEAMGTVNIQVDCPECAQDVALILSWTASAGTIVGYEVYCGQTPDTVNEEVSHLSVSRDLLDPNAPLVEYNATNDLGLRRGDSICFKVKARSDQGVSEYSEAVCAVI